MKTQQAVEKTKERLDKMLRECVYKIVTDGKGFPLIRRAIYDGCVEQLLSLIDEETKKGILAYRQTHHNKYIKEHKERNRQKGLCWDCTSKRVDESKWYCKRCLEIHRKNSRDSYHRRKALVTNLEEK